LGVKRKPARLVFTTGALFASGCAIGDYGDIAYSIGVLSLVVGIIILFWIQNIILFNRDINGS
jgi:phosphoribulokinase